MRQDSGVEFEIAFQDGAGPADVAMALAGVPTAEGFLSDGDPFSSRVEAVAWLEDQPA
jgi:hypothetical protein